MYVARLGEPPNQKKKKKKIIKNRARAREIGVQEAKIKKKI